MKRFYALAFFLLVIVTVPKAQNQYWNYQSQNYVTNPTSAVSIVNSNGYVYFFQQDIINGALSVSEINPISMLPTGINKGLSIPDLTLEGGFEDVHGDFVLYGYRNNGNSSLFPFYMVIDQYIPSASINYLENTNINGRFVRGCSGYDTNGDPAYLHGVYLLQALDNNAHQATCKIVLP